MRSFFALLLVILTFTGNSQSIFFHENFEMPSLDDSITYSSTPNNIYHWDINTRLHEGIASLRCDSCQVKAGTTVYSSTTTFSTLGNPVVVLKFDQICKIDFLDVTAIQVSADNGISWTQLTASQYFGNGAFPFYSSSYGNLWQPPVPNNTMWRHEIFNLSGIIGNCANAKIRFKLGDGGPVGGNNNAGWFIDNLEITDGFDQLSGNVTYGNPQLAIPINSATVTLLNPDNIIVSATTNTSGHFQFMSSASGFNLVEVSTNKPWGGVNATDLLYIMKHLAGQIQLSGLSLLAADVNGDHLVSYLDCFIVYLRINGVINSFPAGDWVFQPTGFLSPQTNPIVVNIKGLCYGDINGSYYPPPTP